MAYYIRIQCSIPHVSGIPEDSVQNTWHFETTDPVMLTGAAECVAALRDFYQAIDGSVFPDSVASPIAVKVYNLADVTPRVPVLTDTIIIVPGAAEPLPSQVALVLSFQGVQESGQPQARRRGRVFIGPNNVSSTSTTDDYSRPDAAVLATLVTAATTLISQASSTGNFWCVYSPTTDATESLADAFFIVTNGWIDNRWDTQRRRLPAATARSLYD